MVLSQAPTIKIGAFSMAGSREIYTKIASIKNTQKITSAMEKVAVSKMKKTQIRMNRSLPYANCIEQVITNLVMTNPEYRHPFMTERKKVKRVGYILVSSDRGLCGGLNTNLFREISQKMQYNYKCGIETDLSIIGAKGLSFSNYIGANVVSSVDNIGEQLSMESLIGTFKVMSDAYIKGDIDSVYIGSNRFINTMTQEAAVKLLLPLKIPNKNQAQPDYIYEPDAKEILDGLMLRYTESKLYQAVVENNAAEQAARMVAMKNATDNAEDLIEDLQLMYNKARQASITQEISEIVGGAAAV